MYLLNMQIASFANIFVHFSHRFVADGMHEDLLRKRHAVDMSQAECVVHRLDCVIAELQTLSVS